jgi:hypothetical protein
MTEIVKGLFGFSPQELSMRRDQELNKEARSFATLTPQQRATEMLYRGGNQLAGAVGGMMGAEDPEMKKASDLQGILKTGDFNTVEGALAMAKQAADMNYSNEAQQMYAHAQSLRKSAADLALTEANTTKALREKAAADPYQKLLESGKFTPASVAAYEKSGNKEDLLFADKIETKGEFERILSDLNLSPEEEKKVKQQWVSAKLNPDGNGLNGLKNQLIQVQIDKINEKREADKEKKTTETNQSVAKLSGLESSLETAFTTAEKALKLAPNSLVGGISQAVASSIPWTDAKALSNLVSSLNSEKAIGTLEELKTQSRTGATGFGALNEKELTLLLNKTRSLDPTDKMFRENLGVVMEGWSRVRKQVRESRLGLQGKKSEAASEDMIEKTIQFNKSKGNMTREQAIQLLKSSGKLPADY